VKMGKQLILHVECGKFKLAYMGRPMDEIA
jgi:hypothetical protein